MPQAWFKRAIGGFIAALIWLPAAPRVVLGAPPPPEPLAGDDAKAEGDALLETLRLQSALGQEGEAQATYNLLRALYPERSEEGKAALEVAYWVAHPPGSEPVTDGQAELVASQTLLGIVGGVAIPLAANPDGPRPFAVGALLGAAAGLGGSLAYSAQGPVTIPEAQSLYWSQVYTATNINLWSAVLNGGSPTQDSLSLGTAGGILLGLPIGYGLHKEFPRSSGQLAATASAGVWGAYYGGLLSVMAYDGAGLEATGIIALIASMTDAALISSYITFKDAPMSRGRVRLVNLGGTLGGLLAGATLILAQPRLEPEPVALFLMGMTTGGLVAGKVLTRNYDSKRNPELFASTDYPALLSLKGGKPAFGQLVPLAFQGTFNDDQGRPVVHQGLKVNLLGGEF